MAGGDKDNPTITAVSVEPPTMCNRAVVTVPSHVLRIFGGLSGGPVVEQSFFNIALEPGRPRGYTGAMKRLAGFAVIVPLLACGAARAQFVVDKVDARRVDEHVRVQVNLNLSLTDAAEQALAHGVPLIVVHEVALQKNGWLWNRVQQRSSERHRLRYHALSGRYVVDSDETVLDTFRTVTDALDYINSTSATFNAPAAGAAYTVAVRSRIDINALPAPLRPTALFSPQWQLSSDWSQWPIDGSSTN